MFDRRGDKVGEEKASRKEKGSKKEQVEYGCVPSKFWYSFFGTRIALPVLKLRFGIKVKPDEKIKALEGPLVIVGNHPSFIDPVIMAATLRGRPINFVAGEFLFRRKIFGPVITKGGCIPKAQFRNDLRTVRAMM
ncbi:MAG: 1-acyl-sn-glycerol-3-phosphate acyltransferase, partial [Clostridiales bacterium]|nr:1-acyl-sn-glycerol-3-phosphate acyltransferase [Clostridiales bacterium]